MLKIFVLCLFCSKPSFAIEENIFKVRGDDSPTTVLEKLGAPKNSSMPSEFKNKETDLKVEKSTDKMITIEFNPAHSFTITDADLFERIQTNDKSDMVDQKLILSDPKTGRIFHLNYQLKVFKLELLPPWVSKNKPMSLKAMLTGSSSLMKVEKKK